MRSSVPSLALFLLAILLMQVDGTLLGVDLNVDIDIIIPKHNCTFKDIACMSKATNVIYPMIIKGVNGAETSDPLVLESICATHSHINYTANDISLKGLLACTCNQLSLIPQNGTFQFDITCPNLVIDVKYYETNAKIGHKYIAGCGSHQIKYHKNKLRFAGIFTSAIHDDNKQLYHAIENMKLKLTTHDVKTTFSGLVYGDNKFGSEAISKKDLRRFEETLLRPILWDKIVEKFSVLYNNGLHAISIQKITSSA